MILSIDGGGLRGVIPAQLMARIDIYLPGWRNEITLRCGTSTGGLLALGLAHGMSPKEMVDVYLNDSAHIFDDSIFDDFKDLSCLLGAKYNLYGLEDVLRRIFGDAKLSDLEHVAVTAVDLDKPLDKRRSWKAKVFHNVPGPDTADLNVPAWKAGMYTAAAPIYFPDCDGYVDGGLWAGNPALAAYALAINEVNNLPENRESIRVLSLSTGSTQDWMEGKNRDRGLVNWNIKLLECIMDTSGDSVDYIMNQIIGKRYHRAKYVLPFPWHMDSVDAVSTMKNWVNSLDITETIKWIENH